MGFFKISENIIRIKNISAQKFIKIQKIKK